MSKTIQIGDLVEHKRTWYLQLGIVKKILYTKEKDSLYDILWVLREEWSHTSYYLQDELELVH